MTAPAHAKRWLRAAAAAFTGILATGTVVRMPVNAAAAIRSHRFACAGAVMVPPLMGRQNALVCGW